MLFPPFAGGSVASEPAGRCATMGGPAAQNSHRRRCVSPLRRGSPGLDPGRARHCDTSPRRREGGAVVACPSGMSEVAPSRPTLQWLQALRGFAALSVVADYAKKRIDDRLWVGAAGVDVFFVISGFIIWTVGSGEEASPGVFVWRRLTRVAPAYWLATGAVIALATLWPTLLRQVTLSPAHVALSLAFIQHIDPRGLPFPVLPPGWSLNYEAVFYGLFTLVLFAPAALRFRLLLAALGGVI